MEDAAQELALSTQPSKNKKPNKQKNPSQTKVVMERDGPNPAGAIPRCAGVSKEAPADGSSQCEPCFCSMYWLQGLGSENAASLFTQHGSAGCPDSTGDVPIQEHFPALAISTLLAAWGIHGATSGWPQLWRAGGSSAQQPFRGLHTPPAALKAEAGRVESPQGRTCSSWALHSPPPTHLALRPSCCHLGACKGQQGCPCPAQVPVQTAGTGFCTPCSLCKSISAFSGPLRV